MLTREQVESRAKAITEDVARHFASDIFRAIATALTAEPYTVVSLKRPLYQSDLDIHLTIEVAKLPSQIALPNGPLPPSR
jgi:hypothetical protein